MNTPSASPRASRASSGWIKKGFMAILGILALAVGWAFASQSNSESGGTASNEQNNTGSDSSSGSSEDSTVHVRSSLKQRVNAPYVAAGITEEDRAQALKRLPELLKLYNQKASEQDAALAVHPSEDPTTCHEDVQRAHLGMVAVLGHVKSTWSVLTSEQQAVAEASYGELAPRIDSGISGGQDTMVYQLINNDAPPIATFVKESLPVLDYLDSLPLVQSGAETGITAAIQQQVDTINANL